MAGHATMQSLRTQHQAGTDTGLGDIKSEIYFRREQVKPGEGASPDARRRSGSTPRPITAGRPAAWERGSGGQFLCSDAAETKLLPGIYAVHQIGDRAHRSSIDSSVTS